MAYKKQISYFGDIIVDPPLNNEELLFLRKWQTTLNEICFYWEKMSPKEKKEISNKKDALLGMVCNDKQSWAIMYAHCPMLNFSKNEINIRGAYQKGCFRQSIQALDYLFFSEDNIFKLLNNRNLFQCKRKMNGIVEGIKENEQYTYIIKDSLVWSCDAKTIDEFNKNKDAYELILKENIFKEKLEEYFPKLLFLKKLETKLENVQINEETKNKNKI